VLPTKPANTGELSDEDLEKIAGGTDVMAVTATVLVTVVSTALVGACIAGIFGSHPSSW
jgi:hypothetical protein